MSFFKHINPLNTPDHLVQKDELFLLREKILQAVLVILTIVGFPVILLASIESVQEQRPGLAVLYAATFLFIALAASLRRLSYSLRGHFLLILAYIIAVSELFESGQIGDVRVFLITFTAFTALLFDYRGVIASILISLATIVGASIYASVTPDPIFPALKNLSIGTDWVTASGVFFMLSSIVAGSIALIISGLGKNIAIQAELSRRLQKERDALEERVEERTRIMARRVAQQRAATEISNAISALSDPETLLQQVVNLIKERFEMYYVGVFLLDSSRQFAVLRAGTGEAGKKMIALGHQLAVSGSSMIGWSITNRKPVVALDVGEQAVRFNNPHLPLTRSEMALPIIARDEVIGAMTIQSDQPNAFDDEDIAILINIANALAIALENDRLYHETRQSLEEIRMLNREYLQRAWTETLDTYGELAYDFENPNTADDVPPEKCSTIELPLMLRDEAIGTITLEVDRPALTADEIAFVDNVTTQAAIALENARLLHETERRAVQEQKLNELAARFSRAMTIDEIIRSAAQELGQLPSVAEVSVQLHTDGQASGPAKYPRTAAGGNGKEHSV